MDQPADLKDAKEVASKVVAEIRALPVLNTPNARAIRRRYSQKLRGANPESLLDLARELLENYDQRGLACELIRNHRAAFESIGEVELEEFG